MPGTANPQSLNRYNHVSNSPLNRIDPSGHCDEGLDQAQREQDYCWQQFNYLRDTYGIYFDSTIWGLEDLNRLRDLFEAFEQAISIQAVRTMFNGLWIRAAAPGELPRAEWTDEKFYDVHTLYIPVGFGTGRTSNADAEGKVTYGMASAAHEMWHHITAWASKYVYGREKLDWAANAVYGAAGGPTLSERCAAMDLACQHRNESYSENLAYAGSRYILELGSTLANVQGAWGGGYDYSRTARANYPDDTAARRLNWSLAQARLTGLITDIQAHFRYR